MELPNTIRCSELSTILGLNKRKSRLTLYHEMRGEIPGQEDNEMLMEGRFFEDAIAQVTRAKFKLVVTNLAPSFQIVDRFISGHPDRQFVEGDRSGPLEVKNTLIGGSGDEEWGASGTDEVPRAYWCQEQGYLGLWNSMGSGGAYKPSDHGYLAARLFAGTELYKIPRDAQVYEQMQQEAERFLRLVHDGTPPDPQSEDDTRRRWLAAPDRKVEAPADIAALVAQLKDILAQVKGAEMVASELRKAIFAFAQEASVLTHNGAVIATIGSDRVFDEAKFQAMCPQILAQCMSFDRGLAKKLAPQEYEACMRAPLTVHEQKRVLRIKEKKS